MILVGGLKIILQEFIHKAQCKFYFKDNVRIMLVILE